MKRSLIHLILALAAFIFVGNVSAETMKVSVNVVSTPLFKDGPKELQSSTFETPTIIGSDISFSGQATSPESSDYYFIVCKSKEVKSYVNGMPVCPGGEWCLSPLTPSGNEANCSHNTINDTDGPRDWFGYACSLLTGTCSEPSQGTGASGSPFYLKTNTAEVLGVQDTKDVSYNIGGIPNDLDVKNIRLESINNRIYLDINLINTSNEVKLIDKVELTTTRLDGKKEFSQSLQTSQELQSSKEVKLGYDFQSNLKPGQYIGFVDLYSQGKIIARSKNTLTVDNIPTAEVLGTSTINLDNFLFIIILFFALLSFIGIVIILKIGTLEKFRISISLLDLVAIATLVSACGFGLFSGYTLIKFYDNSNFSLTSYIKNKVGKSSVKGIESSQSNPEDLIRYTYKDGGLVLYVKPDDESGVIGTLKENTSLRIIDRASGWYRVIYGNDQDGWVKIKDVQ